MDDWSLVPSRNAVSEPAPDLQSTMTATTLFPARLTRPRQAPRRRADHPARNAWRLTRTSSPGQLGNQSRGNALKPLSAQAIHVSPQPISHSQVKDTERPLDTTRPFMDDTGAIGEF